MTNVKHVQSTLVDASSDKRAAAAGRWHDKRSSLRRRHERKLN